VGRKLNSQLSLGRILVTDSVIHCCKKQYVHKNRNEADEGLQNLGLCSALTAFEQGGVLIYRATPVVTRSLSFSVLDHTDKSPRKGMLRT
jgi:hypothetical protein